jgi:hypothetical protein
LYNLRTAVDQRPALYADVPYCAASNTGGAAGSIACGDGWTERQYEVAALLCAWPHGERRRSIVDTIPVHSTPLSEHKCVQGEGAARLFQISPYPYINAGQHLPIIDGLDEDRAREETLTAWRGCRTTPLRRDEAHEPPPFVRYRDERGDMLVLSVGDRTDCPWLLIRLALDRVDRLYAMRAEWLALFGLQPRRVMTAAEKKRQREATAEERALAEATAKVRRFL